MRIIAILFIIILALMLFLIVAPNLIGARSCIVDGIDGAKIKQVKAGMTLEEVTAILGRPFSIHSTKGMHDVVCKKPRPWLDMDLNSQTNIKTEVEKIYNDTHYCCDGNRDDLQDKYVTLIYTKEVILSDYYPMLWVHLDSNYRVNKVFAKQYDGFAGGNDPCIYDNEVKDEEKFRKNFR